MNFLFLLSKEEKSMGKQEMLKALGFNRFVIFVLLISLAIFTSIFVGSRCGDYLAFRNHILNNYFNHDNVEKMLKNKLGQFYTDDDERNFDNFVFSMILSELSELEPINRRPYNVFLFQEILQRYKSEEKELELRNHVKIINNNFSYIKAETFSGLKKTLIGKKEEINSTPYAVIDIRHNEGGEIKDMKDVAELFLPPKRTIAKLYFANDETIYYNQRKKQELQFEHVFILVNEATISSAEMFVLALKHNLDHVTVIGPSTYGKTFGMNIIKLGSGHGFIYIAFEWLGPCDSAEVKPDAYSFAQLLHMNRFDETLINKIINYVGL